MTLPLKSPYPPMDALSALELPQGPAWQYEPKWDGFRCLVFRDGSHVELQSKAGQPLSRYFPELVSAFSALKPKKFVLDGEIVVPVNGELSFDDLLMRIHPAESRIRKLAAETPAMFVAFDMLVDENGKTLAGLPLEERRERLEAFARAYFSKDSRMRLSPATKDFTRAREWFRMAVGLDGIIAKRQDAPYEAGERSGAMQKIKKLRTADCVVGGFRYASKGKMVGSLLLGLYDDKGLLNHVGFTSSIHAAHRAEVTRKLEALIQPPGFTGQSPGGPSRWSTKRSAEWQPLAPKIVVEVQYDHFTGGRFRHGTKLLRWRPDKAPRQCTMAQGRRESRSPLDLL
ncbi:MAG: ATP-dependent DNA ligase [Acidobacteria bacterium]|nr:ATP-dependent DNA ligase [Acidobacteriota bacterium]